MSSPVNTILSARGEPPSLIGIVGVAVPALPRLREVPTQWSIVHVMDRMEEAHGTLSRLPVSARPRGHANSMPRHVYQWADLLAQAETYELERAAAAQNRVRIPPTPAEVTRMEQTFGWLANYLGDKPEVARAVNLAARWACLDHDVARGCKRLGLPKRAFLRRKIHGLRLIATGLVRGKVPIS